MEYVRIVEYNVFHSDKWPLVYYLPVSCLSRDDMQTLENADHRIYDPHRYEGCFERDREEPVSKAMSLIKSKEENIRDTCDGTIVNSILFMYANLEVT